jgi:AcrR family transcriptional regulator
VLVKRLRELQAEATRELIVSAARELFTAQGYAGTSIEDTARHARVAKGALYHHFSAKDTLFRAVYKAVQTEAVSAISVAAGAQTDPWASVRAGLSACLDACLDPAFRRVVVLERVTVLQHDVWEGGVEHGELPMRGPCGTASGRPRPRRRCRGSTCPRRARRLVRRRALHRPSA